MGYRSDSIAISRDMGPLIRERPPGLIKHVLTVLVFWSQVLVVPHLLNCI